MLSFNNLLESIHAQARKEKKKQKKKIIGGDAAFLQTNVTEKSYELDDTKKAELQQLTTTKLISGISGGTTDIESHRKLMKIRKEIKQHKSEQKQNEESVLKPEVDMDTKISVVRSKDKKNAQALPATRINPKLLKREKKLKRKQKEEKEKEDKIVAEQKELENKEQDKEIVHKRTVKVYDNKFRKDGKSKRTKTRSRQKNKKKDNRTVEEKISKLGAKYKE